MNRIEAKQIEYLTPSRTIETLQIIDAESEIYLYLYNHDGLYFKLFKSIFELGKFLFENQQSFLKEFENEELLDGFLEKVDIANLIEKHGEIKK